MLRKTVHQVGFIYKITRSVVCLVCVIIIHVYYKMFKQMTGL